jgi:hypothetical protein
MTPSSHIETDYFGPDGVGGNHSAVKKWLQAHAEKLDEIL